MPLVFALLIAAAPAPRPACGLNHLAQCNSTNQLVWSKPFDTAMKAFLGDMRGSYLYDNAPVVDQALATLGGPPDPPQRLVDGDWLFTACRGHSCEEKGAVVLSSAGGIRAVGMLDFHCHKVPRYQASCENGPTLDVFVPHMGDNRDAIAAIRGWAIAKAAAMRADDSHIAPFQGVDERGIVGERETRRKYPAQRH